MPLEGCPELGKGRSGASSAGSKRCCTRTISYPYSLRARQTRHSFRICGCPDAVAGGPESYENTVAESVLRSGPGSRCGRHGQDPINSLINGLTMSINLCLNDILKIGGKRTHASKMLAEGCHLDLLLCLCHAVNRTLNRRGAVRQYQAARLDWESQDMS